MQGYFGGPYTPPPIEFPAISNNNTQRRQRPFNSAGQGYTSYVNPNDQYGPYQIRPWSAQGYYGQPNAGYGSGYGAAQWGGWLPNSAGVAGTSTAAGANMQPQQQQQQQRGPYPQGQLPVFQTPPPFYGMQPYEMSMSPAASDMGDYNSFLTLDHMKAALKLNPNPYYYMNR